MKMDYNSQNIAKVTLEHKENKTIMRNDKGLELSFENLNDSTIILAMLHQTFIARLHAWENVSSDFSIELTIKEVVK